MTDSAAPGLTDAECAKITDAVLREIGPFRERTFVGNCLIRAGYAAANGQVSAIHDRHHCTDGREKGWPKDVCSQCMGRGTDIPAASPPADAATIATLETRLREVAAERAQAEAEIGRLMRELNRAVDEGANAEAARDQAVALLRRIMAWDAAEPDDWMEIANAIRAFLASAKADEASDGLTAGYINALNARLERAETLLRGTIDYLYVDDALHDPIRAFLATQASYGGQT